MGCNIKLLKEAFCKVENIRHAAEMWDAIHFSPLHSDIKQQRTRNVLPMDEVDFTDTEDDEAAYYSRTRNRNTKDQLTNK